MSKHEILNKAIADASTHYKEHGRRVSLCDALKELGNNDSYFISICNEDISVEHKLNQKLQTLFVNSPVNSTQQTEDIHLSLLCLSGHIARLEERRLYPAIAVAMIGLTLAVWPTLDSPKKIVLITFTVIGVAFLWLVKWRTDQRIFLHKRTAEHLKFLADRA